MIHNGNKRRKTLLGIGTLRRFSASVNVQTLCWSIFFLSISFSDVLHAVPAAEQLLSIADAPLVLEEHEQDGAQLVSTLCAGSSTRFPCLGAQR